LADNEAIRLRTAPRLGRPAQPLGVRSAGIGQHRDLDQRGLVPGGERGRAEQLHQLQRAPDDPDRDPDDRPPTVNRAQRDLDALPMSEDLGAGQLLDQPSG